MASKRPLSKTGKTSDQGLTDEWGIYDPAKAGMPALFARLGRPILQAAPTSARRERRRALRPERSTEGVGLAIAEARKRAGLDVDDVPAVPPGVGGNPARAMRMALRAQATLNAERASAVEPFMPPQLPPTAAAMAPLEKSQNVPTPKKRATRKASGRHVKDAAPAAAPPEPASADAGGRAATPRARKSANGRALRQAPAPEAVAAPATSAAPPAVPSQPNPPGPPAPSARRPRGPVPLAAWARAVSNEPKPERRQAESRGFWRGLFRIPTEVALVEYAHGARIHRLLIEAGDDLLPDLI